MRRKTLLTSHLSRLTSQWKRRDREFVFARQVERLAAGDKEFEARAAHDQGGEERRGGKEVLEVVHDQEQIAVLEGEGEGVLDGKPGDVANAESLGDGRRDLGSIGDGGEGDEDDAVGEFGAEAGANLEGKPRLPGPTGAGQRDDADIDAAKESARRTELGIRVRSAASGAVAVRMAGESRRPHAGGRRRPAGTRPGYR